MIDKPAKYIDRILEILSEDYNHTYTIQEIQNKITPIQIFGEDGNVVFSPDLLIDLRQALGFLETKKLVQLFYPFEDAAKITFEGYLKLKTNSFSKEISEKKLNQTLQRIAWTIPIIISIFALIISVSNSQNKNNTTQKNKTVESHNEKTTCPKQIKNTK